MCQEYTLTFLFHLKDLLLLRSLSKSILALLFQKSQLQSSFKMMDNASHSASWKQFGLCTWGNLRGKPHRTHYFSAWIYSSYKHGLGELILAKMGSHFPHEWGLTQILKLHGGGVNDVKMKTRNKNDKTWSECEVIREQVKAGIWNKPWAKKRRKTNQWTYDRK